MKKGVIFSFIVLLTLALPLISAINVQVSKNIVNDQVVSEINVPAIINLQIKNLGQTDNFEIYSLISGVDISPRGLFQIQNGETKSIQAYISLGEELRQRSGMLTFTYQIKSQESGIQEDTMTVNIAKLREALYVGAYNIFPDSSKATIYLENRLNASFPEIQATFSSAFFTQEAMFPLSPLETKLINITLDKNKIKRLVAGQYTLNSKIEVEDAKVNLEGIIKYVEQSGLAVKDESSGIIFHNRIIEKTNEGNLPVIAEIRVNRDIISRLLTTFNVNPVKVDRNALMVHYSWTKELAPGESLAVSVKTNYLYPLIVLIIIIIIAYLIYIYKRSYISLNKRVHFVRTKGGEFALKVVLTVSSRKYIEKIHIVDKLPQLVKLYEKFTSFPPDKVDQAHGRVEWNLQSLSPGEERVFSYIIYSKVGVVGRFELPAAVAIYEESGKTYQVSSNRAFFVNEPFRRSEEYRDKGL